MWEGLIHKRLNVTERLGSKKTKEGFKELIGENDFDPIFSDFYENFIVCDCNSPEEVIDGVPNRNGVSHSKYKKYRFLIFFVKYSQDKNRYFIF